MNSISMTLRKLEIVLLCWPPHAKNKTAESRMAAGKHGKRGIFRLQIAQNTVHTHTGQRYPIPPKGIVVGTCQGTPFTSPQGNPDIDAYRHPEIRASTRKLPDPCQNTGLGFRGGEVEG